MAGDVRDTLLLPFQNGEILPLPGKEKWCFLNAQPLQRIDIKWSDILDCEQGFRSDYLRLMDGGYDVVPVMDGSRKYAGSLVLLGRNRKVNEYNLARAWNGVRDAGTIICAGDKRAGIQSLKKWTAKRADVSGCLSKNHAQVFWLTRTGARWPLENLSCDVAGYRTAHGMFSAGGPDIGSMLLAEKFTEQISGKIADLGAGWGYLSNELLMRSRVVSIDLFEADHTSLEAAKLNIKQDSHANLRFHWCDVVNEQIDGRFDWVIMNPPFHTRRDADTDLGRDFIKTAADILVKGGRLMMVANTHLPYEQTLGERFQSVAQIDQQDGFKIIEAVF